MGVYLQRISSDWVEKSRIAAAGRAEIIISRWFPCCFQNGIQKLASRRRHLRRHSRDSVYEYGSIYYGFVIMINIHIDFLTLKIRGSIAVQIFEAQKS
jgi:hypothetical protein